MCDIIKKISYNKEKNRKAATLISFHFDWCKIFWEIIVDLNLFDYLFNSRDISLYNKSCQ